MTEEKKPASPEEQVASGFCPECYESLEGRDPVAHAGRHWRGSGDQLPDPESEGGKRRKALMGDKA